MRVPALGGLFLFPLFFLPLTLPFSARSAASVIFSFGQRLTALSAFVFTLQPPVSGVVSVAVSIFIFRALAVLFHSRTVYCPTFLAQGESRKRAIVLFSTTDAFMIRFEFQIPAILTHFLSSGHAAGVPTVLVQRFSSLITGAVAAVGAAW